jgi:hypothetical protein
MEAGSCTEPWRNTVNVSVRQSLGALGLGSALNTTALNRLTLQLDIFNLANFINRDWAIDRGLPAEHPQLSYNSLENPASSRRRPFRLEPATGAQSAEHRAELPASSRWVRVRSGARASGQQ